MSKMRDGYGSECHLLRWMGRHRNAFNQAVRLACEKSEAEPIHWLDFAFDREEKWPDRERKGLEFISALELQTVWHNFWPQRGEPQNWDAVGQWGNHDSQEWLLVEAKANLQEIKSKGGGEEHGGRPKIRAALQHTAAAIGATYSDAWLTKHYQLANRLAVLNLLHKHKQRARLLLIYFVGDLGNAQRVCPQSAAEWHDALTEQKQELGLPQNHKLSDFVHTLFLHVSKSSAWLSSDNDAPERLLSGEIRVADAARLMEDAG